MATPSPQLSERSREALLVSSGEDTEGFRPKSRMSNHLSNEMRGSSWPVVQEEVDIKHRGIMGQGCSLPSQRTGQRRNPQEDGGGHTSLKSVG